ncbi:ATP-dependent RecD-like DNA helicase [Novibacillus thermophilus]|uniref:ATP-dependent RecD2 DNA helicase n=1 Tax=Novibacillus thermophilus TaxID=1471761 RepID=A0A1U9K5E1_9BACL|nr:ATP-dependent RecD-like DNA helicase [Novibacillus thermophilus]AQS55248.1 hypothetical protein B0W44_05095 [Novibacillus thermophilus]
MYQQRLSLSDECFVKGTVERVIYYNRESGYGVCLFRVSESSEPVETEEVTVVGLMASPQEGLTYTCRGEWESHPRYGEQFRVKRMEQDMPRSREAVIKYLSSDLFPGIGPKTATKIVSELGDDALKKIVDNPELLQGIPGVSEEKAEMISDTVRQHTDFEQVMLLLYEYGIGSSLALKIYNTYKHDTLAVLKQNPYQLIYDIEGIGFARADAIGRETGIPKDAPERKKAAVLYVLSQAANGDGHVCLKMDELCEHVSKLLGADFDSDEWHERLRTFIYELDEEEKVVLDSDEEMVYLPSLYYSEQGLAKKLNWLLMQDKAEYPIDVVYRVIGELEEAFGVQFADEQRDALVTAACEPVMILTGGPGTGKTTVIRAICHLLSRLEEFSLDEADYRGSDKPYPVRLVAPTGRAAKRMSEATSLPAMTIHRLLGWRGDFFEHDADHPISGRLLIVDEASMMDMWLAYQLVRTVPEGMKVIFVGDADQLPSVGPGQVLHHMIESGRIPYVDLRYIFRQAEGSSIVSLAHEMKRGSLPDNILEPTDDRRFFPCDKDHVAPVAVKLVQQAMKRGYSIFDVQVLAPIYRGPAGIDLLNRELQQAINPRREGKRELTWGDSVFRLGDKVLQLSNHPEHPVYNGDIGKVIALDENVTDGICLWVRFDQTEVGYTRSQLNQLSLAYCISIHKAQGSEFPIVVLPVVQAYRRMLKRNLVYTAVTRAKAYLMLCGEVSALSDGVRKEGGFNRRSLLKDRLQRE